MESNNQTSSVFVEGSMLNDGDSSSDSDSDIEVDGNNLSDSDEESLEVFGTETERDNNHKHQRHSDKPSVTQTQQIITLPSEVQLSGATEEFGIKYIKVTQPKTADVFDIELVDEASLSEVNNEVRHTTVGAYNPAAKLKFVANDFEDDEFDFDAHSDSADFNAALAKALDTVANSEDTITSSDVLDEEPVPTSGKGPTAKLSSFVAAFQPTEEPILSPHSAVNLQSPGPLDGAAGENAPNILADARKAFQAISEIYCGGMGDLEVRILDDINTGSAVEASTVLDRRVAGCTIEEGDEEAEEQEEAAEEAQLQQAAIHESEQKSALESEWESVGHDDSVHCADNSAGKSDASVAFLKPNQRTKRSYKETLRYLQTRDLQRFAGSVITHEASRGSSVWTLGFGGTRALSYASPEQCASDLSLPFLIAQLDFDPADAEMAVVLATIYRFFVSPAAAADVTEQGDKRTLSSGDGTDDLVPTTGAHWEKIGFQGVDPRTDLNRSMKMLALLQMLRLMETDASFARRMHQLSESEVAAPLQRGSSRPGGSVDHSWPFMCVAIMFTKEALQALRGGALNDKCNKRKQVLSVLHDFHHGCFAEFHRLLSEQPNVHHAVHLAAVRKMCETNPHRILKAWKQHRTQSNGGPLAERSGGASRVTYNSSNSGGGIQGVGNAAEDGFLTTFDNLESLAEDGPPRETQGEVTGRGGWFFGGQSKAAKFRAE